MEQLILSRLTFKFLIQKCWVLEPFQVLAMLPWLIFLFLWKKEVYLLIDNTSIWLTYLGLPMEVPGLSRWCRGKESTCQCRRPKRLVSIPVLGKFGVRNDNLLQYSCLEIQWTEKPGGLQSTGLQRVRHYWVRARAHTHTHTHSGVATVIALYTWQHY